MISPSVRARAIRESVTLAISARARSMRAAGIDVVSLGAGEPDFGTMESVANAGIEAIRSGETRYTDAAGTPAARSAGAAWFQRRFHLPFEQDDVMVTAGAKPALMMALMALADDGDRVLLPAPYWPSYPDMVKIAGGEPITLPAVPENGFVHTGDAIAAAARTHGAKGLVINFPNNPSGAAASAAQIEQIADAAIAENLWILSDEIYARLIYDGVPHVSPAGIERARDRVMVVNGGTKSHSMTGWRVGFLAGPRQLIAAAAALQSQAIGNPCSISQRAVIEMCADGAADDEELARRLAAFDERRRYLFGAINSIDGLSLELPPGAFYALVDARAVCERFGCDDVELGERLLTDGLVATVPGTAFAIPGFIRLSYAASMTDLETAVERIRAFVASAP